MKTMKRMFAIVLSLMMALGMMTTAFAYDISLIGDKTTNHEYTVYQLFTGDLETLNGKNVLINVKYGSAGLGTEGADVPDTVLDAIEDADAYATSILANYTLTDCGSLTADNGYKLEDVDAGYYLIVDETGKTLSAGDSYSKYIVEVVEDVAMAPKSEKVTSDKNEYNDAKQLTKVNEAGVGAIVSYDITAKIAADADVYDKYFFVLNDTLSEGLTFNDDIVVTIGGQPAVLGTDYVVYKTPDTDNGHTFEIALLDAKAHPGAEVKVNYSATVNDKAVVEHPETNDFTVTYSRDPHHKYDHEDEDDNGDKKPGKPIKTPSDAKGETPKKTTKTYTCQIDLTKRADSEDGDVLPGAVFQLTSDNANNTIMANHEYYAVDAAGTYYKLKDGTYTTTAPTTEVVYNKIGVGDENTTEGYILVDGAYIVPDDKTLYNGEDLYEQKTGNIDLYEDITNKYAKKTETVLTSEPSPVNIKMTTDENGKISFKDLGTGTYTLTELVAPEGYNLAAPKTIEITFDAENEKFVINDVTEDDSIYDVTVVDKSGAELPETGGIGTTLFYTVGGMMVVAAGVLLITKKRMNA